MCKRQSHSCCLQKGGGDFGLLLPVLVGDGALLVRSNLSWQEDSTLTAGNYPNNCSGNVNTVGWGFAIQKSGTSETGSCFFLLLFLSNKIPSCFTWETCNIAIPKATKKSHKPDLLQHPLWWSYLKTELKHTVYLKIIFNLYLKLQHLHFHAFPCKHKRKKKEKSRNPAYYIISKPGLQRLNPQEHWGATKLSPFFSVTALTRSCRICCTQRREMQNKVLLTLHAWGACCVKPEILCWLKLGVIFQASYHLESMSQYHEGNKIWMLILLLVCPL